MESGFQASSVKVSKIKNNRKIKKNQKYLEVKLQVPLFYGNYIKRCNAFLKIPTDSLFLISKGISFHSLNNKYDESNWPLPHRDLLILKSLAWRVW